MMQPMHIVLYLNFVTAFSGVHSIVYGNSRSWTGRESGISPVGSSLTGSGRSLSGTSLLLVPRVIPWPFMMAPRLPPLPAQVFPILLTRRRKGMLSGAGWWIAAVHSLHHHASHPRGGEQVATLLHRWMKPLVVFDPAQARIPVGKSIGVGVFPAWPVVHLEPEVLEGQDLPRHPGVGVLGAGHPFQRCVVGDQRELPA